MTEDFGYDNMDRLETIDLYNGSLLTQNSASYYSNGNIQTRSDVGLYSYSNNQPHALVEINDPVGQLPEDQSVSFNATNKIQAISQGFYSTNFTYGPDDMRRKMEIHEFHNLVSTRYYQGAYEEEVFANGNIKKTHYISSPDGLTAMMIEDQTGSQLYYVATDFLGSICGLMDANGNMVEEFSYDAWGNRRNPNDWAQSDTRISFITDRGYTGHEHLDQFGLINMNGRVYDPVVGRFLSPDPVVQTEGGSQSMNAYSYALNNPLKYTDPTGYRTTSPYVNMSVEGANQNSQHMWDMYNSQNQIYGRQEFWNSGGSSLSTFYSSPVGGLFQFSNSGMFVSTNPFLDGYTPAFHDGERGIWVHADYYTVIPAHVLKTYGSLHASGMDKQEMLFASSIQVVKQDNWVSFEPTYEAFEALRNFGGYGSPESEIVTTASSSAGFYNTVNSAARNAPLKYSKYTGFIGPAGDLISTVGAIDNLIKDPNNPEYWTDGAITLVGWIPGFGDAIALLYMFEKAAQKYNPEEYQRMQREIYGWEEKNGVIHGPDWTIMGIP